MGTVLVPLPRPWLPVVLVLLLCFAGSAVAQDAPPTLYLAGPTPTGSISFLNFSSYPPNATNPTPIPPAPIGLTAANWTWTMSRVPVDWTLVAGTRVEGVFFIEQLDSTAPIANPVSDPDGIGRLKVTFDILNGDPASPVGSGFVLLDSAMIAQDPGVQEIRITAEVSADSTYFSTPGESLMFGIRVGVTGRMAPDDPAFVLVEGLATPSRIEVPSFPLAAFRAWEDAERAEVECNARILQGLPCEPIPPEEPARESPPAGVLGLLAVLGAAARLARQRIPTVSPAGSRITRVPLGPAAVSSPVRT